MSVLNLEKSEVDAIQKAHAKVQVLEEMYSDNSKDDDLRSKIVSDLAAAKLEFEQMKDNSIAIFFSGVSKVASEDEYLPFCVNKNFFYLTNIKQEHSALLLIKGIGERREYLFIDPYSELKEKWTGKRLTPDKASAISDIKNIPF